MNITDLDTKDVEQGKICGKTSDFYVPLGTGIRSQARFEEGLEFCENIGGNMAVIGRQTFLHVSHQHLDYFRGDSMPFSHNINLEIVPMSNTLTLCCEV